MDHSVVWLSNLSGKEKKILPLKCFCCLRIGCYYTQQTDKLQVMYYHIFLVLKSESRYSAYIFLHFHLFMYVFIYFLQRAVHCDGAVVAPNFSVRYARVSSALWVPHYASELIYTNRYNRYKKKIHIIVTLHQPGSTLSPNSVESSLCYYGIVFLWSSSCRSLILCDLNPLSSAWKHLSPCHSRTPHIFFPSAFAFV